MACTGTIAATASAEAFDVPTVTRAEPGFFGLPGLVDMPTADMMPDGEILTTFSNFAGTTRATLAFQIAPRLAGSFRYTGLRNWNADGFDTYYDRSFDLRLQLLTETDWRPAVTLGLQDFIGTGLYAGEFLAASKSFGDSVSVTGGIGWGRLGSFNSIGSFGDRPPQTAESIGTGGKLNADQWFHGDAALFGGLAWRPIDKLTLKAEYSSDAYDIEVGERRLFNRDASLNFGVEYQLATDIRLGAYSLYGSEFGVQLSIGLNPARPPVPGGKEIGGATVLERPSRAAAPQIYDTGWAASEPAQIQLRDSLAAALRAERMEMEALDLTATEARLYLRNKGYRAPAQAIGRSLRLMSVMLPASVETFTIIQTIQGLALPAISFSRRDVEVFSTQPDGAEQMLARARVDTAPGRPLEADRAPGTYPRLTWSFGPYMRTSLFDPDNPFRADIGLAFGTAWQPAPGLIFAGTVQKKVVGNLDQNSRPSDSVLPHVRSDYALYDREGDPAISEVYGAYYFQTGSETFGRVSVGYLERMHAGVSGEVLWAPFDLPYAFGAEVNYTRQRDFDGGFGLQDYDVVSGHLSAYWRFDDNFFAQVDLGRYLAKDYGGTLSLERVFANGWRVGAFATITDVSAEDFGEGSFDKGITMTIPIDWIIGRPTRVTQDFVVRPLTRDGGARLEVPGRLYGVVEDGRRVRLEDQWGRFWR
ncbi:MAG: YjbH domain-containing protein [Rhodobacteraceae bacterium]|nr:YjbH domain-containing protein [Paracoccaceae bacterium]